MCGFAGCLFPSGHREDALSNIAREMIRKIEYRGPDSFGSWVDGDAGIALGHLRLAIVDLTPAGHQPMVSASGRYVFVFNGEIYNHLELRAKLESQGHAPRWKGHSDTEVLLAAIDAWGLKIALSETQGMFALLLWDRAERRLLLARDRMGEKPLYYGWQGNGDDRAFLFASELKAFTEHPSFENSIERASIPEILRHGHVGEDRSVFKGIRKVRPAEMVTLDLASDKITHAQYWDGTQVAVDGSRRSDARSESELIDALDTLLKDTVSKQMMSDVPLGAFLSGGVDSSAIVALMKAVSDQPVLTYSIGFQEARFNEAEFAKDVAQHLGTKHTELYVSDGELLDVVPKLPYLFDEPFADSSQIPTYLVAGLARRHVTVALSGDGGDEIFAGYDRYAQLSKVAKRIFGVPGFGRRAASALVQSGPVIWLNTALGVAMDTPEGKEPPGQRLKRLSEYAASEDLDALHRLAVSRWRSPRPASLGQAAAPSLLDENVPARGQLSDMARMMQLDMLTYLPDDILAKVDRSTMAVSLESRAPFLDHNVVEFAWNLPDHMKWRDGSSKWILRQVLYKYVPKALIERPKQGFEVPIGIWLRGPLRDWAEALLDPSRLASDGYFDARIIRRHWDQHLKGHCDWGKQLWNVLMFQAWLDARAASWSEALPDQTAA